MKACPLFSPPSSYSTTGQPSISNITSTTPLSTDLKALGRVLPRKCSDSQAATYSPCDRPGMQGRPGQPAKSLMSDLWEIFESSLCLSWLREMWRLEMRPRQVGLLVLLGQRARPVPRVLGQYAKRLIDLGSCQLWEACGQFQYILVWPLF